MGTVTEETGRVATSAISALAGTPTLLVMVLLNIVMILATAWYLHEQELSDAALLKLLMAQCYPGPAHAGGAAP